MDQPTQLTFQERSLANYHPIIQNWISTIDSYNQDVPSCFNYVSEFMLYYHSHMVSKMGVKLSWQQTMGQTHPKTKGCPDFDCGLYNRIAMISEIEKEMEKILKNWRQLHLVLKEKSDVERNEEQIENQVCVLASSLKESFEANHNRISALQQPQFDPDQTQEQHRKAVLDYRWTVQQLKIWEEQLSKQIENLLAAEDDQYLE